MMLIVIRRVIRRVIMVMMMIIITTYNFDRNSVPLIISISNNVNTIIMISMFEELDDIR